VTVPQWNGLFLFDDMQSMNEYIQTMFRIQSRGENYSNKKFCYVFDYSPERCLKMRYQYIHYAMHKNNNTEEEIIELINDIMPIIYYDQTGRMYSNDEVREKMFELNKKLFREGFTSFGLSILNQTNWNSSYIKTLCPIFKDVKISSEKNSETVEVNTNDLQDDDKSIITKIHNILEKNATDNQKEKELSKIMEQCATCLKSIPEFIFLTDENVQYINHYLMPKYKELFKKCIGIDMEDFKELIKLGLIDINRLDCAIFNFLEDKKYIYNLAKDCEGNKDDIDDTEEFLDEFYKKWIYEKDSASIDIPFKIIKSFILC
jgi:hypothetical protein